MSAATDPRLIALLGLVACQPYAPREPEARCVLAPLDPGEVWAGPLACGGMRLAGGEGRTRDVWLGNAWFRAVLRDPHSALTVPGVGGGTLVDAAPWGMADGLHEVIPLVGGGWLDVDRMDVGPDRVIVSGTVAPLPGVPGADVGAWREIVWAPDPDGPWLRVLGADALWLHPARGEVLDGQVVAEATWGHDGVVAADHGGVLEIAGATGLLVARTDEAATWLAPTTRSVSGTAPGADRVALLRDGAVVGRAALAGDAFDQPVAADADGLRAEADGHAPGPVVAPGTNLDLPLGAWGALVFEASPSTAAQRPLAVDWRDDHGRAGSALVPPRGGALPLGAGTYDLVLSAGPASVPVHRRVAVPDGARVPVPAALPWRFDPGSRVLVDLAWFGARSRTFRGTDAEALRAAVGSGIGFAVVAPTADVASAAGPPTDRTWLRWRNGVHLPSEAGWGITAWPWGADARQGGHGAADTLGLSAADALAAAWGGPGTDRFLAVDLAWLEAAGPPWTLRPVPDVARLDHPGVGPDAGAWEPWFAWLDAAVPVVPTGPRAWVTVDDPRAFAGVDVEQGLTRGRVVATTGGLVTLTVDGHGPGDVLPPGRPGPLDPGWTVHVTARSGATPFDHVALVVDGEVQRHWSADDGDLDRVARLERGGDWALAVAWDDAGDAWATTGPIWLSPPNRP